MNSIHKIALGELIPNMDGIIDPVELGELKTQCKEIAAAFQELANYAEAKRDAMVCRTNGNIATALKFEATADAVYQRLPEWARW